MLKIIEKELVLKKEIMKLLAVFALVQHAIIVEGKGKRVTKFTSYSPSVATV